MTTRTHITASRAGSGAAALLPALALLLAMAGPALADGARERDSRLQESFAGMDTDGDGFASVQEFLAARPNMKEAAFKAMDGDGDGRLSREEWMAFMGGHGRPAMGSGRMGGMNGMGASGGDAGGTCPAFEGGNAAGMPMVMPPPAVSHGTAK